MPENGSINEGTTGTTPTTGTPAGTGTATALSQTAQDYGQKISDAASTAKDYLSIKSRSSATNSKNFRTRISARSQRTRKNMRDRNPAKLYSSQQPPVCYSV
jgi:hypothetical protein